MSTQTLLVHLPTPESREEYLHSLHWLAIDVVVRMKSSGFNVAAFRPYDSMSFGWRRRAAFRSRALLGVGGRGEASRGVRQRPMLPPS